MRWFKRLADVPGLSYEGSQTVDRTKLPGHDLQPEVRDFGIGGAESHRHLRWPTSEGDSPSWSPVRRRVFGFGKDTTPQEALRQLEETLELPGELFDYHLAIQGVCKAVYEGRREDLSLLEEVERLCWLDIELVESYPEIVEAQPGEYYHVLAYGHLVALYEGGGYFHEALQVAKRGFRMGQEHLPQAAERLRMVLEELKAEDEGR